MLSTHARSCVCADDAKSCTVGMRNAKLGNHLKKAGLLSFRVFSIKTSTLNRGFLSIF